MLCDYPCNVLIVPMTNWMPNIADRPGPKYLAIADSISEAISAGTLSQGTKLPPQRNLAYDLGVTLGTVTRAYREVERRGLTGGEVGRGTFVLGSRYSRRDAFMSQQPTSPNVIEMIHAIPIVRLDDSALPDTLSAMAAEPEISRMLGYQMNTGMERHLEAGADWLRRCGLSATADTVTLTAGGQQAILASLMAIAEPGDTILVEELTYPGIIHLARTIGYRLETVTIDEEGILPESFEQACKHSSAKILYCMPTFHNPTLATMPEERRRRVASIAEANGIIIIEDDIWGVLANTGIPPITSIAPDQAIYLASLSKSLAGGLRIGYVHASQALTRKIRSSMKIICWMPPPLMAEIASRWITDGTAERLVKDQRRLTADRVEMVKAHLKPHGVVGKPAAHHCWLPLSAPWTGDGFRSELESRGVRVLSEATFCAGRKSVSPAVRLCLGQPADPGMIERAVEIIADALSGREQREEIFI